MDESLSPVVYGATPDAPASQRVVRSSLDFEATLTRLRDSIERADLWLIHEIDPRKLVARGGHAILPARQLLFFHPRFMRRILETNPNAILEAPLRIIVMQHPEGHVSVRHPDIVRSFAMHDGLETMGAELEAIYGTLRSAVSAV